MQKPVMSRIFNPADAQQGDGPEGLEHVADHLSGGEGVDDGRGGNTQSLAGR